MVLLAEWLRGASMMRWDIWFCIKRECSLCTQMLHDTQILIKLHHAEPALESNYELHGVVLPAQQYFFESHVQLPLGTRPDPMAECGCYSVSFSGSLQSPLAILLHQGSDHRWSHHQGRWVWWASVATQLASTPQRMLQIWKMFYSASQPLTLPREVSQTTFVASLRLLWPEQGKIIPW